MPGLLGYFFRPNCSSKNFKHSLIDEMCNSIVYQERYKRDVIVGENLAIARLHQNIFNPEPQPLYSEDRSLFIFMYGKIYDYEYDLHRLEIIGHKFRFRNDPEYCLHLYQEKGVDFVKKLNGSYTICIYDKVKNSLFIINDRYGSRPIYYYESEQYLIFASEIKAILQKQDVPRNICQTSLGQFFHYGQLLGDTTFIEGIKVLPPASILTYNENTFCIDEYWKFIYKSNYKISENKYVNLLIDAWENAVKIRMEDKYKYGLALSGGLDSRSILAAVPHEKVKELTTFTFGSEKSGEVKIAKKVANICGAPHYSLNMDIDISAKCYVNKIADVNEGMNGIETSVILSSYDKIRNKIDVCFDGLGGDAFLGGGYLFANFKKNGKGVYKEITKARIEKKSVFNKCEMLELFKYGDNVVNIYNNFINSYLSLDYNTTLLNQFDSQIMFDTRVRRHTMLGDDQMRTCFEEATPTLDNRFVELFLQIPPELRINHKIYRKFLLKLSPRLSKIKYLRTNVPVFYPIIYWTIGINIKRLIKRIIQVLDKLSSGKITYSKKNEGEINLRDWIRNNKNWNILVTDYLNRLPDEIFNKEYVNGILKEHLEGIRDNSNKISHLVSFSIFYNNYV